jgi:hypothetical protein
VRVRWIGLTLALLLLGGGAGYAAARLAADDPADVATAAPLPASSPSYPVTEYEIEPDPAIAPLPTDLPLEEVSLRAGGLEMTASVPAGWQRFRLSGGDSWNFTDPDNPANTYLLRLGIDAGDRVSVTVARDSRIAALEDAERNGALQHVVVEERRDEGFTATYISGGYQRVTMERFLPQHGSSQAYATVAVSGRENDRVGMADLLERVSTSADY